mmetsp:Transcript_7774/g.21646  ORF Transcript_7774/g.21646 Transcript_7774/m.21646 type:complete len:558 (-) Transcript_7774:1261-2934(-)|eukprot:CAMPEP_0181024344 /NCGR_PEP_ID=MMETSP1070-20121207/2522_1 /TAXON_ID=265543 /ORGANISM="Minutocellus polymorphus, Strain NH13" /LENGTH=557 /DNA_ID=CAMNT_0023101395 /DNA_START=10 /DNA_END=1683 /DNA_ORIENTATION=+
MRYGPVDFNYTFVRSEEDEAAAAAADIEAEAEAGLKNEGGQQQPEKPSGGSTTPTKLKSTADDPLRRSSRAADESTKPYVYVPSKKYGLGGGRGGDGLSDDDVLGGGAGGGAAEALTALIGGSGACCCCISAALIIAGGIMLAYEKYDRPEGSEGSVSNQGLALAGVIVLVLAVATFLLGFCSCCFGCVTACAYPPGSGGGPFGGALGGPPMDYEDENRDVKVQFKRLNDRYERAENALNRVHLNVIGDMKEVREAQQKEDKARKDEDKKKREELEKRVQKDLEAGLTIRNMRRNYRPVAFLVRFDGDMMLSSMELLRKQVSIIVNCGRAGVDRAVVVITSPGGAVSPYGLAASQLVRIRKAGIQLVVCVDTVAASGGYMMASVGDTVCAAPFAVIGSIGVVTQIPNFQRFLNKHDIDAYLFTAGKHKRTVDIIGEVTEENKKKLQEELDDMHRAFKDHVALARPKLKDNIEEIASGEYWVAVQAKELGLVDEIMTSDEYLESISQENEIIEIVEKRRRTVWSAFHAVASVMKTAVDSISSVKSPNDYRTTPPMAMA